MTQPDDIRPWETPLAVPPKPADIEYGYFERGVLNSCTREQLIERVGKASFWALTDASVLVWTPETDALVGAEQVPYLFEALKEKIKTKANYEAAGGLIFIVMFFVFLGLYSSFRLPSRRTIMFLIVFFLLPGVYAIWSANKAIQKNRDITPEQMKETANSYLATWVQSFKLTWTKNIGVCFLAIWIWEVWAKSGIEAAGLVKPNVRNGEIWRLVTCAFLHVNFQHLFMNFMSFMAIGRMVEVFLHRAHLVITFLISALGGSLCSLFLMPNTTSVGASGGIMGLIGLLAIASWKRKSIMPRNYYRGIFIAIGLTALIGVIGIDFIDNAAHFGGLVSGVLLGLILIKRGDTSLPLNPHWFTVKAGTVSLGLIVLSAGFTGLALSGQSNYLGLLAAASVIVAAVIIPKWKYLDKF